MGKVTVRGLVARDGMMVQRQRGGAGCTPGRAKRGAQSFVHRVAEQHTSPAHPCSPLCPALRFPSRLALFLARFSPRRCSWLTLSLSPIHLRTFSLSYPLHEEALRCTHRPLPRPSSLGAAAGTLEDALCSPQGVFAGTDR